MMRATCGQRCRGSSAPRRRPAMENGWQGYPAQSKSTAPRHGRPSKVPTSSQIGASSMLRSRILATRIAAAKASRSTRPMVRTDGRAIWRPRSSPPAPLHKLSTCMWATPEPADCLIAVVAKQPVCVRKALPDHQTPQYSRRCHRLPMLRSAAIPVIQRKEFRRRLAATVAFAAIGPDHFVFQFRSAPPVRRSPLLRMETLIREAPCVPAGAAPGLQALTRGRSPNRVLLRQGRAAGRARVAEGLRRALDPPHPARPQSGAGPKDATSIRATRVAAA